MINKFGDMLHSVALKLEELLHKMPNPDSPNHSPLSSSANPSSTSLFHAHCMKLEVQWFDSVDPLGWIFKITQFFRYHSTLKHKSLTIASFYMEG